MTVNEIQEIGKKFENILKLKTKPIGIKFFKQIKDAPEGYEWIKRKKVICNLIGFSRFYEIPVAITKENTNKLCPVADVSMGFGTVPEGFAEKAVGGFAKSLEETSKIFNNMNTFKLDEYAAVGICPLEYSLVVPDVIQIWGNPTQMLELEYANTWNHGDGKIELITNGHGASCYETMTWPIIEDKLRFAIADMGDKRHGYAGDNDMILGAPIGKVKELLAGLKETMNTLNRLPVLYNFDDIDFPVPSYSLAHSPYLGKG